MNLQHDLTRPVGWSATLGHFIDGAMVRVVGLMAEAEEDKDWAELKELGRRYWDCHHSEGTEGLRAELSQRVVPEVLDEQSTIFLRVETLVAVRDGLASRLYPELFDLDSSYVDKDGLVDYAHLLTRVKMLSPGVFMDQEHGLLLFAHRFFRRSQSHVNKLNDYFLDSFSRAAKDELVRARLRLDPDRVGHPAELHGLLEFEYWHGPRYSDDIASIPSGVATHKADEETRKLEGVDKTQVWWKPLESRSGEGGVATFRTLELEELRDLPSSGLPEDRYACRYAHAEYSLREQLVTHFDGAIRAYPTEKYLERIELNIDRAGKHSEYTKLFRFDGALSVGQWKRLLSDYFRGNPLVPEYLGAPTDGLEKERTASALFESAALAEPLEQEERLSVFVQLQPGAASKKLSFVLKEAATPDRSGTFSFMETGGASVDKLLRQRADLSMVASMLAVDGRLELVPLVFGMAEGFPDAMHSLVADLADALAHDILKLELRDVALTLIWPHGNLLTSLSIRGTPRPLLKLLQKLFVVVNASEPASKWIEALATAVRELAPQSKEDHDLHGILDGRLSFERGDVDAELVFPKSLTEKLKGNGLFGI
ncbi:hypothetical protein [Mitsuaria sp. 7]|uniref:hypothetical protein n=1 Tax=Mitsuaria sp. 7 TaxID=1658665 RepID=UPI0012F8E679|nr:hypothetical protein [Mitsuaria sp. 7]